MAEYFFVYGSLRPAGTHPMADFLARHTRRINRGYTPGRLYRVAWYPGAIDDLTAATRIWGALLEVCSPAPQRLWTTLDEYEGVDPEDPARSLFVRKKVPVTLGSQVYEAWFYRYNGQVKGLPQIDSGDFLAEG